MFMMSELVLEFDAFVCLLVFNGKQIIVIYANSMGEFTLKHRVEWIIENLDRRLTTLTKYNAPIVSAHRSQTHLIQVIVHMYMFVLPHSMEMGKSSTPCV